MIDWNKCKDEDCLKIEEAADRFAVIYREKMGKAAHRIDVIMSLTAAQIKEPMDLDRLLAAKDFDFVHDISGIIIHVDHSTGELRDCFSPRCGHRK